MGKIIPLPTREHRELQTLLPWYAADALDPADRLKVERHLAHCARCREELGQESHLQSKLERTSFDVEHDWSSLRARIEGQSSGRSPRALLASARRWIAAPAQPAWGWLLAAQSLLLVTLGVGAFYWSQPRYHALSAPSPAPGGNVIVMFRPDTPEKDFREALRSGGVRLVDGPTEAGVYVLHAPPETRAAVIAALHRRREVSLAEPIDSGERR
jgi:hypothetical protein